MRVSDSSNSCFHFWGGAFAQKCKTVVKICFVALAIFALASAATKYGQNFGPSSYFSDSNLPSNTIGSFSSNDLPTISPEREEHPDSMIPDLPLSGIFPSDGWMEFRSCTNPEVVNYLDKMKECVDYGPRGLDCTPPATASIRSKSVLSRIFGFPNGDVIRTIGDASSSRCVSVGLKDQPGIAQVCCKSDSSGFHECHEKWIPDRNLAFPQSQLSMEHSLFTQSFSYIGACFQDAVNRIKHCCGQWFEDRSIHDMTNRSDVHYFQNIRGYEMYFDPNKPQNAFVEEEDE